MGWDVVVEILEYNLVLINERQSQEILSSEEIRDEERAALKSSILNNVENSGGDETSYWIDIHPNLTRWHLSECINTKMTLGK